MSKKNKQYKHYTYLQLVWQQFKKNKLAYISLYIVLFLFIIAIFAPFIANDKPIFIIHNGKIYFPFIKNYREFKEMNWKKYIPAKSDVILYPIVFFSPTEYDLDETLSPPDKKHIFGTDDRGRDVFARIVWGTRISLSVGFVAVTIALIIGLFIGSLAGYYGGKIDIYLSRFIEIIECFPTFILILVILAFLKPSIFNIMAVIGLFGWTGIARLIRGEILKIKNQEYVLAARAAGLSDFRIIVSHILPNAMAPVLVSVTFGIAGAILMESGLSFLGFGVQPPTPSWGEILSQANNYVDFAWWLTIFPGMAIFITVLAYNLIGEGIRDAIDPRLKS